MIKTPKLRNWSILKNFSKFLQKVGKVEIIVTIIFDNLQKYLMLLSNSEEI